jgi:quinol monooxygenase YgiN
MPSISSIPKCSYQIRGVRSEDNTGWLHCRPGKRDEFLTLMEPLVAVRRQEAGCRIFQYYRSDRSADRIIMLETFDSAEAHEFHRRTPHMFEMQAIVRCLLGQTRLLEVVSHTSQHYDLDFIANPPGVYSPD